MTFKSTKPDVNNSNRRLTCSNHRASLIIALWMILARNTKTLSKRLEKCMIRTGLKCLTF